MPADKKKHKISFATIGMLLLFVVLSFIIIFPIICLIISALKPSEEIIRFGLNADLDFSIMNFHNFVNLFQTKSDYFKWFTNSLMLTVIQMLLSIFVSAMVAYGFSMYEFRFKKILFSCVLLMFGLSI